MRQFLKIFIILVSLWSFGLASELIEIKEIALKKDEQTKILVKYETYIREFQFRWTLYVNEGLVVFHSYDKRVFQNVLYLNTINQSFKVLLKSKGADFYEPPHFLIKFEKFDFEKNKAIFKIFISDRNSQIKIEYPKNK